MKKIKETITKYQCEICKEVHWNEASAQWCEAKCKSKNSLPEDREKILQTLKVYCPELLIGDWDCDKSFYGKCIQINQGYDEVCIFCGEPEERK